MLRDIPYIMGIMVLGIFLVITTGHYYQTSIQQDSIVLDMNEIVRASAVSSADNKSRINAGELFIVKPDFENNVKTKMNNQHNKKLSEKAIFQFEYLDNETGSTKAIRVKVIDGKKEYQTTAKIDISEI
uniref:hypothetical protein n=1 Tax=Carnobacterium sp. TaxID=48221 RepID=UPI00344E2ECA